MKTVQPINDLLLVKIEEKNMKTPSGLYMSDRWKQVNNVAAIIAVGKGVKEKSLKVAARVVVNPYALLPVAGIASTNQEEKDSYFLREQDVLAIWED